MHNCSWVSNQMDDLKCQGVLLQYDMFRQKLLHLDVRIVNPGYHVDMVYSNGFDHNCFCVEAIGVIPKANACLRTVQIV